MGGDKIEGRESGEAVEKTHTVVDERSRAQSSGMGERGKIKTEEGGSREVRDTVDPGRVSEAESLELYSKPNLDTVRT